MRFLRHFVGFWLGKQYVLLQVFGNIKPLWQGLAVDKMSKKRTFCRLIQK